MQYRNRLGVDTWSLSPEDDDAVAVALLLPPRQSRTNFLRLHVDGWQVRVETRKCHEGPLVSTRIETEKGELSSPGSSLYGDVDYLEGWLIRREAVTTWNPVGVLEVMAVSV